MPELTIKEFKEIKGAYLAKKQGEALERSTWPQDHKEGLGLGYFEAETVLALKAIDVYEDVLNKLTGLTDKTLHNFTEGIGVASGSRTAKRLEKSLETIGQLGQYRPEPPKWQTWGVDEKKLDDSK